MKHISSVVVALVILCLSGVLSGGTGCGGALQDPAAKEAATCSLEAVEKPLADGTALALVVQALKSAEYKQAIDELVQKVGVDLVRCAVQTIAGVTGLDLGIGSGAKVTAGVSVGSRAAEVAKAKGWR